MNKCFGLLPALLLVVCADSTFARMPRDELQLDAMSAFAIGTDVNIHSVREVDADSLNAVIETRWRGLGDLANSPAILAILLTGADVAGQHQAVETWGSSGEAPSDWFRVTVENDGYGNDSVNGSRWVLWLERVADGGLMVRRCLWAQRCQRIHWTYYSTSPCP